MRKVMILSLLVLLLLGAAAALQAQDAVPNPAEMARYFPADTGFFVAFRLDDAYIDQLDTLSQIGLNLQQRVVSALSGDVTPPLSLRDQLNQSLRSLNTDLDSILGWLGDLGAVAAVPGTDGTPQFSLVLELADRQGLEAFLQATEPDDWRESRLEGTTRVFDQRDPIIAITDDYLVVYNRTAADRPDPNADRPSLSQNEDFGAALGQLPAKNYNVMMYVDAADLNEPQFQSSLILLSAAGPAAVGLTILDDTTLVIDSAQRPATNTAATGAPAVDPDFLRFIPTNASAVIQATDFTNLYNNILSAATVAAQASGSSDEQMSVQAQLESIAQMVGIDLQDDLLSWTTGEYGLFIRSNIVDLANDLSQTEALDVASRFDLGLVIEATDPAAAAAFAQKVGSLAQQFAGQAEGVTISQDTIDDVPVTVISINAPLPAPARAYKTDLLIGATEEVFFIATRPAVATIIAGDGSLMDSAAFREAEAYFLPNPTSISFADGEGFVTTTSLATIVPLALLGPSIGNVFADIVAELQQGTLVPSPTPTSTPTPTPGPLLPPAVAQAIESSIRTVSSSSITSTLTADGTTIIRLALTYQMP